MVPLTAAAHRVEQQPGSSDVRLSAGGELLKRPKASGDALRRARLKPSTPPERLVEEASARSVASSRWWAGRGAAASPPRPRSSPAGGAPGGSLSGPRTAWKGSAHSSIGAHVDSARSRRGFMTSARPRRRAHRARPQPRATPWRRLRAAGSQTRASRRQRRPVRQRNRAADLAAGRRGRGAAPAQRSRVGLGGVTAMCYVRHVSGRVGVRELRQT